MLYHWNSIGYKLFFSEWMSIMVYFKCAYFSLTHTLLLENFFLFFFLIRYPNFIGEVINFVYYDDIFFFNLIGIKKKDEDWIVSISIQCVSYFIKLNFIDTHTHIYLHSVFNFAWMIFTKIHLDFIYYFRDVMILFLFWTKTESQCHSKSSSQ